MAYGRSRQSLLDCLRSFHSVIHVTLVWVNECFPFLIHADEQFSGPLTHFYGWLLGPVPPTFDDFWRMVWEQQSSTIVMLTNLQERHKVCGRVISMKL